MSSRAAQPPRQESGLLHALARRVGLLLVAVLVVGAALPITSTFARNGLPSAQGSGQHRGSWLVTFRKGVASDDAGGTLAAAGATEVGRLDDLGTRVVKLPPGNPAAALRRLAADPRVVAVEEDVTAEATLIPNDPRWTKAWGPRVIRAPEAWNVTTGTGKTVIAIIDTGVDPRHPELSGRLVPGWDFQNGDSNPRDDNGHGTAVANVAAAGGNDGIGMAGICWKCKVMPVKVLNANGSGTHSNIAAGIVWAVKNGADIINMSIAGPRASTVMANAVAFARRKGVVVIAAAGNEGSRSLYYPAAYPGVISVAASNGSDVLYSWSNRGSWVKLAAPGCAFTGKPGPAWSWWCGTSFATPAVAGTAALIKSLRPRLSRADLERLLMRSTIDLRGVTKGRIDAARAVRRAAALSSNTQPAPSPTPTPTPDATATPTPIP
jgi:subtilisin family serine protease